MYSRGDANIANTVATTGTMIISMECDTTTMMGGTATTSTTTAMTTSTTMAASSSRGVTCAETPRGTMTSNAAIAT